MCCGNVKLESCAHSSIYKGDDSFARLAMDDVVGIRMFLFGLGLASDDFSCVDMISVQQCPTTADQDAAVANMTRY